MSVLFVSVSVSVSEYLSLLWLDRLGLGDDLGAGAGGGLAASRNGRGLLGVSLRAAAGRSGGGAAGCGPP